jgi:hypothetical protein
MGRTAAPPNFFLGRTSEKADKAKFAFLAFSEVNPDNVAVYTQTHKLSAPAQPCAVFQK